MLAIKRPRRAAVTEDSLDPRVMTERQQLAFLLRATAPSDDSASSSESNSTSDSEEDDEPSYRRQPSKRIKTRPARAIGKELPDASDAPPVIYCGRGRPPKNSIKLPKFTTHLHSRAPMRMSPRSHNTRSREAAGETSITAGLSPENLLANRALQVERNGRDELIKQDKSSPSSASDVAMLHNSVSFCALCCDLEPFGDAPLFLCPSCDQKYPTQQALGRVCMA